MTIMDIYMERHLTQLHDTATASRMKEKLVLFTIALLIIFLMPVIHLGMYVVHGML